MSNLNFIAVGNDELAAMDNLGTVVRCWVCGGEHPVENGKRVLADGSTMVESGAVQFFVCGTKAYLCGVNGKAWRPRDEVESDGSVL